MSNKTLSNAGMSKEILENKYVSSRAINFVRHEVRGIELRAILIK